jgi:hypothetical protein
MSIILNTIDIVPDIIFYTQQSLYTYRYKEKI